NIGSMLRDPVDGIGFPTRKALQQLTESLTHRRCRPLSNMDYLRAVLTRPLAEPQKDRRRFLFGLEGYAEHHRSLLQLAERHTVLQRRSGDFPGQEIELFHRVRPCSKIDVMGVQGHPRELAVGVG